jgi:hypothetical protein
LNLIRDFVSALAFRSDFQLFMLDAHRRKLAFGREAVAR